MALTGAHRRLLREAAEAGGAMADRLLTGAAGKATGAAEAAGVADETAREEAAGAGMAGTGQAETGGRIAALPPVRTAGAPRAEAGWAVEEVSPPLAPHHLAEQQLGISGSLC